MATKKKGGKYAAPKATKRKTTKVVTALGVLELTDAEIAAVKAGREKAAQSTSTKRSKASKKSTKAKATKVSKKKKPQSSSGKTRGPVSPAPLIGKGKDWDAEPDHPCWMKVNDEKTLMAVHTPDQFPQELRLRVLEDEPYKVLLELFGEQRRVFAGAELVIPCNQGGGGQGHVHYELVDQHNRSGLTFKVYRKYSNQRRQMESDRSMILPG